MSAITFDTLKYTKRLRDAGYTEQQAEAATEAQRDCLNEVLDSTLATRQDIHGLEIKITKIETDIVHLKWMSGVVIGGIIALLIRGFMH